MMIPARNRLILAAFFGLGLLGLSCSKRIPGSPIAYNHLVTRTPTNASFVWVTITNQSDFAICFLAEPPEVLTNGIWSGPPRPSGQRLTTLAAKQSAVVAVEAAAVGNNGRAPFLWGYSYLKTRNRSHLQEAIDGLVMQARGHGDQGLLYTTYLTDLKL